MALPYSISDGDIADATEVNQNFKYLVDTMTDGKKTLTVNDLSPRGGMTHGKFIHDISDTVITATGGVQDVNLQSTRYAIWQSVTSANTYITFHLTNPSSGQIITIINRNTATNKNRLYVDSIQDDSGDDIKLEKGEYSQVVYIRDKYFNETEYEY